MSVKSSSSTWARRYVRHNPVTERHMPDERNSVSYSRFFSRMFTLNFVGTCCVFRTKPCACAFFLRVKKWSLWRYLSTNIHTKNEDGSRPVNRRLFNLLKPKDIYVCICIYIYIYICRTAALTSRHYILNIYSTNIHTEYFKHAA